MATNRGERNQKARDTRGVRPGAEKDTKRTRVSTDTGGFHEQRKKENKQEDRRKKAIEKKRVSDKEYKKREAERSGVNRNEPADRNTKQGVGKSGTSSGEGDKFSELKNLPSTAEGQKGNTGFDAKELVRGNRKFNPFSYRSVKTSLVDDVANKAAKETLNKAYFGLGTLIEKANHKMTGEDKVDYVKKLSPQGKLLLMAIAVLVVVIAWVAATTAVVLLIFGVAAVILHDGGGDGSGTSSKPAQTQDTGLSSGKVKDLPPELLGKFLLPNTERATSMTGMRQNPTGNPPVTRKHSGADMAHRQPGYSSLKIYPIAPGKVVKVTDKYQNGTGKGLGNMIIIDHMNGYTSLYGHLTPGIPVKVGDMVGIDTVIGIMGHTGNSTNFHLHLEMYKGGANEAQNDKYWIDSFRMLSCSATEPVPYGVGMKTKCYEYQKKVRGIQ